MHSLGGDSVVVFNEVMYHPRDGDSLEWVELFNQMAVDVDLSGWSVDGIGYTFPTNTIIGGGKYIVIASDPAELAKRSGLSNVFGPFGGKLANEGERLRLLNLNERVMDSLEYDSKFPWPEGPDGSGFTLAKRGPTLASKSGECWTQSSQPGGTPGSANFLGTMVELPIALSEVAGTTNSPFWLELVNRGSTPVDISAFQLEFARAQDQPFLIPTNTVLQPGGYFVFNPEGYIPRSDEKLFFYNAERTQLLDSVELKSRPRARSDRYGARWLVPNSTTPGSANLFILEDAVVINEIMYGSTYGKTNAGWVELFNKSGQSVDLTGWKLSGTSYVFPANSSIDPGEYLVIARDPLTLKANNASIRILGELPTDLSRSSDHLVLEDAVGNPADEVRYFDNDPWPAFADSEAASLELRDPNADNSRAEAWAASAAPGDWQSYSYSAVATADKGPTYWNEFIFGLLDAGEVLLDDFSVIENPGANGRELLQNGTFENGGASWRFLGTQRNATVIPDSKDPANHVLRLIADGPTEHMHNHVETTLVNNAPIKNGTTYKISWRAKWIAGCNKLNTRLYFNRVANTTTLARPTRIGSPGAPNSVLEPNIGPTFSGLKHVPVVPKPTEPVQISVSATDPDGVKQCRLWSRVNTGSWTAIEMTATNGSYSASLPARPAATVVQFYIEAKDNRGAISFYPASGTNSRALYKVNDNQALSSRIHNFRLLMLPAEATALHAATNVMSNGDSRCTVIYDESEVFYNCALHLQGSERGRNDPNRVGFTVRFPADQPFRGVQDNITFDPSGGWSGRGGRHDEIVIRHIINQAGDSPDMYDDLVRVLTPLTTHTGTSLLLMTKYSGEFFDGSVYPDQGSLFKIELIYSPVTSVNNDPQLPKLPQPDDVVGSDLGSLGNARELYRWFFLAENHPDADEYESLIRLSQAFNLSGTALQQRLSELVDMEQWTRVFAFKSLSGDPDTYGFGYTHNQLFYVPLQGKALTLPWDLDYAWARSPTDPISVGSRVGQVISTIPANQRLYYGNLLDIINTSFNTNYMARWTAHYGTLAGENYGGLLSYIGQRANSARGQLPQPALFAVTTFSGNILFTNVPSITLKGTAPYTLKRLQLNDEAPGTGFTWTAVQNWESTVALKYGTNRITLVGYNFHNQPVITNQLTIVSSFGIPDRDGDQMDDDWELRTGLNPDVADADLDPDQDHLTNLAEYLAGTLPLDPNSNLRLTLEQLSPSQINLSFRAMAGRGYRIQYRVGVGGGWTDILPVPAATQDRLISLPQTLSNFTPALFYRVILDNTAR